MHKNKPNHIRANVEICKGEKKVYDSTNVNCVFGTKKFYLIGSDRWPINSPANSEKMQNLKVGCDVMYSGSSVLTC
jgi:hypothetical protein